MTEQRAANKASPVRADTPKPGRPARAIAIAMFTLHASVYSILSLGSFQSFDEITTFETSRSLRKSGELSIPPYWNAVRGPDDRRYSQRGWSLAISALPFTATGAWLDTALSPDLRFTLAGPPLSAPMCEAYCRWGGDLETVAYLFFFTLLAALVPVAVFLLALELGASGKASVAVAVSVSLFSYFGAYARTGFVQPVTALCGVTAFLFAVCYVRRDHRPLFAALSGAAIAFAVWIRPDALLFAAGPIVIMFVRPFSVLRSRRASVKAALGFVIPIAVAGAGLLLLYTSLFGGPTTTGYLHEGSGESFSTPLWFGLTGNLISPFKGVIFYAPFLLFVPSSVARMRRFDARTTDAIIVVCITYLILYSKWYDWFGGWAYGPRLIAIIVPLAAVLTIPSFESICARRSRPLTTIASLIAIVGAFVFLAGSVGDFNETLRRHFSGPDPEYTVWGGPEATVLLAHIGDLLGGRWNLWLLQLVQRDGAFIAIVLGVGWGLIAALSIRKISYEISDLHAHYPPQLGLSVSDPPLRVQPRGRIHELFIGVSLAAFGTVFAWGLAEVLLSLLPQSRPPAKRMLLNERQPEAKWLCYSTNPHGELDPAPDVTRDLDVWTLMESPLDPKPMDLARLGETPFCMEMRMSAQDVREETFAPKPEPNTVRLVGVGDSFTTGDGVPNELSLFKQLEAQLGPGFEAINGGVSGASLEHGVERLTALCKQFSPDTALFVFLINDIDATTELAKQQRYINDLINIRQHRLTTHDRAAWYDRRSRVIQLVGRTLAQRRISAQTTDWYHDLYDPALNLENLEALSRRIESLAQIPNCRVAFLLYPLLQDLDRYPFRDEHRRVATMARNAGLDVLDLTDAFAGHDTTALWVHPADHHPNGTAHGIAAKAIAHWLTTEHPELLQAFRR